MANKGGPVQFKGIRKAIEAYENMGFAPWSLWCGNAMNLSYDGSDIETGKAKLDAYLRMCDEESPATYTLCVYEKLPKNTRITNALPYHASFNFKLTEGEYPSKSMQRNDERFERLMQVVEIQNKKIEELSERINGEHDEEPEAVGGIAGIFNGLLEMPGVKEAIAGKVVSLLDKFNLLPMNKTESQQIGKVAGVEPSPDEVQKINSALVTLLKHDPHLGDHLERLAEIAENSPGKFQSLITMLKVF